MKLSFINRKQITVGDRFRKEHGDLSALITSIETVEVIQPIAIEEIGKNKYKLVAGGRRIQAFDSLEMTDIPCRIYEKGTDPAKIMMAELEENLRRKALTPQEELANTLALHEYLIETHGEKKNPTDPNDKGWSAAKTAKYLGKDPGNITKELNTAMAAQVFPEINEAKTKDEALKIYKNIRGKHEKLIKADEVRKQVTETPEEIRKKALMDSFIVVDVFKGMKSLPDACADLVELDPPYAISLEEAKKLKSEASKVELKEYDEISVDEYFHFLPNLLKECYRVLKKDRWMLLWFGPKPWYAYPFDITLDEKVVEVQRRNLIVEWLEQAGFTVNFMPCIWDKSDGACQTKSPKVNLARSYEMFIAARKGQAFLHKEGRYNMYEYKPIPPLRKVHPTERPIDMTTDIIATFVPEGSHIVVPCCGSGNSMLGANNHLCSSVGFEINPARKDDYIIKVEEGTLGDYTSPTTEEK